MLAALVLILLALAPTAAAQQYNAPPSVFARRHGQGGETRAAMDVHAPPAAVRRVLTTCAGAERIMIELISCRLLDQGEAYEVFEHRVRGWPLQPVLRNVSRVELRADGGIFFHRIDGDWTRSEGEWVLTPIDGGAGTHIEYRWSAALRNGPPFWLSQPLFVSRVRRTLLAIRREAEAAHGTGEEAGE